VEVDDDGAEATIVMAAVMAVLHRHQHLLQERNQPTSAATAGHHPEEEADNVPPLAPAVATPADAPTTPTPRRDPPKQKTNDCNSNANKENSKKHKRQHFSRRKPNNRQK
jgi:hypothetical protein